MLLKTGVRRAVVTGFFFAFFFLVEQAVQNFLSPTSASSRASSPQP